MADYRRELLEMSEAGDGLAEAALQRQRVMADAVLAQAARRKSEQRAAMEAVNAARVAGARDALRAAKELKRQSFAPERPGYAWVEEYITKDGTHVKGHWRRIAHPAQPEPLNPQAAEAAAGVGITGKVLGTLGLDESGERARTSWGRAFSNTLRGASLLNQVQAIGEAIVRARGGAGAVSGGDVLAIGSAQVGGAAFGTAPKGALTTGIVRRVGDIAKAADDRNALGLYSQAQRAVAELKQEKGTGQQMLAMLKKAGVKDEEIKWTGLDKLAGEKSITKAQLIEHLERNKVALEERRFGGEAHLVAADGRHTYDDQGRLTRISIRGEGDFDVAWSAGSARIRHKDEVIADISPGERVPVSEDIIEAAIDDWVTDIINRTIGPSQFEGMQQTFGDNYRERLIKWNMEPPEEQRQLPASHWDAETGIVAHTRTTTQFLDEPAVGLEKGARLHHLDEVQSDWGQKLQNQPNLTPEARAARLEQLSQQIAELTGKTALLRKAGVDLIGEEGFREGARSPIFMHQTDVLRALQLIADEHGYAPTRQKARDLAAALAAAERDLTHAVGQRRTLEAPTTPAGPFVTSTSKWVDVLLKTQLIEAAREGLDGLSIVRGHSKARLNDQTGDKAAGTIKFYDQVLVNRLREMVRKLDPDARLSVARVAGGSDATVIPITPKMREKLLNEGLPMFTNTGIIGVPATIGQGSGGAGSPRRDPLGRPQTHGERVRYLRYLLNRRRES
ncbi:MAG: hypothetical protein ACM31O_03735 [Bacteroidota bacterium]